MMTIMLSATQQLRVLVVLALVQFTHTMDFMVLIPLGPQLMRLFSITPQQFTFVLSVYTLAAGIFGLLGSMLFDRVDRKHALIGVYIGFMIGTLGCAIAPNYWTLLWARALSGAFGGVISGITFSIVADLFDLELRGYAMSRVIAAFSIATILGVPVGIYLANNFGWHAPFFLIFALGALTLVAATLVIPPVRGHLKHRHSDWLAGLKLAAKDSNSRKALAMTLMMVLSQFTVIPFIAPFLTRNMGFREINLPYLYFLGGLFTTISGPLTGKFCDRYGASNVFKMTGLLFLVPVFVMTHLPVGTVPVVLVVSTLFFILSNSRFVPAMTLISSSVPNARRGSFLSLNSCVQQIGSAIASFSGGFLVTQSANGTLVGFGTTAWFAAIFGTIAYLLGRRIRAIA